MGLIVHSAESGPEALEILEHHRIDVVLLNVKTPEMDGIETMRYIRNLKPLVEVVLLTGHASVDSGIDGMKLGAFDYLMKPIELEPLCEKLDDAYEKKKLHQEKIEMFQMKKHMAITGWAYNNCSLFNNFEGEKRS